MAGMEEIGGSGWIGRAGRSVRSRQEQAGAGASRRQRVHRQAGGRAATAAAAAEVLLNS